MKTTTTNVIRWAGLAAIGAGSLFIGIQAIHPTRRACVGHDRAGGQSSTTVGIAM